MSLLTSTAVQADQDTHTRVLGSVETVTAVPSQIRISRSDFDAAIFDLDGVLTDTAPIHAAAWKQVFDDYLRRRADCRDEPFKPFGLATDYLAFVDGRPRYDGVRCFLASRGIALPEESNRDPPAPDTVRALGDRKARLVLERLSQGVDPAPGSSRILQAMRRAGMRLAVASSSANCAAALTGAGLADHLDARVDGVDALALGLAGKPDPALFLEAARRLNVAPGRTVLFEDSLVGVQAGRRGGFGLVVGVDRGGQRGALLANGAVVVIRSLLEVLVEQPAEDHRI